MERYNRINGFHYNKKKNNNTIKLKKKLRLQNFQLYNIIFPVIYIYIIKMTKNWDGLYRFTKATNKIK